MCEFFNDFFACTFEILLEYLPKKFRILLTMDELNIIF